MQVSFDLERKSFSFREPRANLITLSKALILNVDSAFDRLLWPYSADIDISLAGPVYFIYRISREKVEGLLKKWQIEEDFKLFDCKKGRIVMGREGDMYYFAT